MQINGIYDCRILPYEKLDFAKGDFIVADFEKKNYFELTKLSDCNLDNFSFFNSPNTPIVSEKLKYLNMCQSIIDTIQLNIFSKAVLSRIAVEKFSRSIIEIYHDLCKQYPKTFIYLLSIEGFGTWMGASPELFMEFDKNAIMTTSLAGTKTDREAPWGDKEKEEQEIVSRFIEEQMLLCGAVNIQKTDPYTFDTGALFHLKTDFKGSIHYDNQMALIKKLHPTPATCGMPQDITLNHIINTEAHERSLYCGFLGPITKTKSQLFVNLRCMQILHDQAYLYVGGGITVDSEPEKEWEETVNKTKTLASFLS
jgi:isochorismate synthase